MCADLEFLDDVGVYDADGADQASARNWVTGCEPTEDCKGDTEGGGDGVDTECA